MTKVLRSLRRIALALAIIFLIAVVVTQWALPVALSIQTAHKPQNQAWLIPREVADHSVSSAPGTKLSYFGYEFEVPWTDLDDSKTESYPDAVLLAFHSGLKLMVGAAPPKLWLNGLFGKPKIMQARVEQTFGVHSDYDFMKVMYNFTPDKMHLWAVSPRVHYREVYLIGIKSVAVRPEAKAGFFYVGNSMNAGFQEGDPQAWPSNYRTKSRSAVFIQLFSDQGCLNLTLFQQDFQKPAGISQADLNRIIQSVQRADGSVAGKAARSQ